MCELCDIPDGFILTICHTCGIPMVVSKEHKADFNAEEMVKIDLMFRGHKIRWEQRKIPDHAHAHILD